MITTNVVPALTNASWPGFSNPKALLVESLLVVAAGLFWLCALPMIAVALIAVKIWDTCVALVSGKMVRPNPLILRRRSPATPFMRRRAARAAQA